MALTQGRSNRLTAWVALALTAATLAAYHGVGRLGFVFDDEDYVVNNVSIRQGLTLRGVRWALSSNYASNWHPLTWLSHMADVQLYGLSPAGHHLTSLLLHVVNTLCLFWVLRRMTGAVGRSAFVAALFALHPLHVESVAWVAERKDVLSGFLFLLTVWAYARYCDRPRVARYLPVVLLFGLGLAAKPMLVTLPFVLLLLDYWPLRRVDGAPSVPSGAPGLRIRRLIGEKIPLFALSAASSVVTYIAQSETGAVYHAAETTFEARLANALVSYARYLGKTVWPEDLCAFYPTPPQGHPPWLVAASALLLVLVTVWVIRAGRRRRYLPVGWLWYLGTLVPVVGLVQVGMQSMADRYTYLPLIGVFVCVSWGGYELAGRSKRPAALLLGSAGLCLAALGALTWRQVGTWRDDVTLYGHATEAVPDNWFMHYDLGAALAKLGRGTEAVAEYEETVRVRPDHGDAWYNLGVELTKLGRAEEAATAYSRALAVRPDDADAHANLAKLRLAEGRIDEAVGHLTEALRIDPTHRGARFSLALALAHRRTATPATPPPEGSAPAGTGEEDPYRRGNELFAASRFEEAAAAFREAIRRAPSSAGAYNNLGVTCGRLHRFREAEDALHEALRLRPEYPNARANLQQILSMQGR